jgi:hypothetical protein
MHMHALQVCGSYIYFVNEVLIPADSLKTLAPLNVPDDLPWLELLAPKLPTVPSPEQSVPAPAPTDGAVAPSVGGVPTKVCFECVQPTYVFFHANNAATTNYIRMPLLALPLLCTSLSVRKVPQTPPLS